MTKELKNRSPLRAVWCYVIAYWVHTFGIRVEADIRRDLFVHMQELDISFFDKNRTGQLMSRLTSDLFEFTELAKGRTTLIIAHRLSTIRKANRILAAALGEIVEQGNHEQLFALDSVYADLWRTQNGRNDG